MKTMMSVLYRHVSLLMAPILYLFIQRQLQTTTYPNSARALNFLVSIPTRHQQLPRLLIY